MAATFVVVSVVGATVAVDVVVITVVVDDDSVVAVRAGAVLAMTEETVVEALVAVIVNVVVVVLVAVVFVVAKTAGAADMAVVVNVAAMVLVRAVVRVAVAVEDTAVFVDTPVRVESDRAFDGLIVDAGERQCWSLTYKSQPKACAGVPATPSAWYKMHALAGAAFAPPPYANPLHPVRRAHFAAHTCKLQKTSANVYCVMMFPPPVESPCVFLVARPKLNSTPSEQNVRAAVVVVVVAGRVVVCGSLQTGALR